MGARLEIPPYVPETRWIKPYFWSIASTSQTATAGRVYLTEFEILTPVTIDAIMVNNNTTVAGNVIVGIYGPIVTEETCVGSSVIVESASTALSGANTAQAISITPTTLYPGRYYVAVEYDNATHTFTRQTNFTQVTGWTQYYDRGGGYGALTSPCPSVTTNPSGFPTMLLRGVV